MKEYTLLTKPLNHYLGESFSSQQLTQIQASINRQTALIEQAEIHGVAPLFYQFINDVALDIPSETKRQFQALALRHQHASRLRARVLTDVVMHFERRDIPIVLLKGVALANMIYTQPWHRPMRDMDILVPESRQSGAKSVLENLGFVFDESHASFYMGNMHHLPNAVKVLDGLQISLELHHQVYSRDQLGDQVCFEQIAGRARRVAVNDQVSALTLDHVSMLRHLCRHTFSIAPEVRLIHQFDILKYVQFFFNELPWQQLCTQEKFIINTIRCLHYSLNLPEIIKQSITVPQAVAPQGVGKAMLPYTHILANKKTFVERGKALFFPSAWWMHVNYNVAPEQSLLISYLFKHPKRVLKDIGMRLYYSLKHKMILRHL